VPSFSFRMSNQNFTCMSHVHHCISCSRSCEALQDTLPRLCAALISMSVSLSCLSQISEAVSALHVFQLHFVCSARILPSHPPQLHHLIIFVEKYKVWNSTFCILLLLASF
jgi:hypothetical protein